MTVWFNLGSDLVVALSHFQTKVQSLLE